LNEAYEKGLNYALYLLSLQMRTVEELRTKLKNKTYEDDLVEAIINFLKTSKYLDDVNYAVIYMRTKRERFGDYRIDNTLVQKGISRDDIEKAKNLLEDEEGEQDPEAFARGVLDKKIATLSIDWGRLKTDYKYKYSTYQKLAHFLAGRGFSGRVIKTVISERLAEHFFDE
jgi:regulatory protein